jgi:hypothetical protein
MDSVCEILINVVTANKPKVLTGLPKKGMEPVQEVFVLLS